LIRPKIKTKTSTGSFHLIKWPNTISLPSGSMCFQKLINKSSHILVTVKVPHKYWLPFQRTVTSSGPGWRHAFWLLLWQDFNLWLLLYSYIFEIMIKDLRFLRRWGRKFLQKPLPAVSSI
jgi:hypothetical protein